MGLRFRKSIKIFPGIRINLSKSGISTSVGVPGATVNIKSNKTTATAGLPGTGVSYRSSSQIPEPPGQDRRISGGAVLFWGLVAFAVVMALLAH